MAVQFTTTQKQRLIELDAPADKLAACFGSQEERNQGFATLQDELITKNKALLQSLRDGLGRPLLRQMETQLALALVEAGFVEVVTPATLAKEALYRMGIDETHPLWKQIFWLEDGRCLRPMLAPNLYALLSRLGKLWPAPIRIFEVGSCYRKESKGSCHLSEFTMLNLVELGLENSPEQRLQELIALVMAKVGLEYQLVSEESEVYGQTVDVLIAGDLEAASGTWGPHPLDEKWGITESWVGVGFGLERLTMVKGGFGQIRRVGRSLIYLDGARLNL
ncbi:MAG: pyrrolysine--tRNA(Pyl) ligase large subunit [Clostridia bacterium]|nr:pyrrolysine--tRNA(Pyl) ligase large subunit [Clostridia bacterium]